MRWGMIASGGPKEEARWAFGRECLMERLRHATRVEELRDIWRDHLRVRSMGDDATTPHIVPAELRATFQRKSRHPLTSLSKIGEAFLRFPPAIFRRRGR